jgi:hypothetical protein
VFKQSIHSLLLFGFFLFEVFFELLLNVFFPFLNDMHLFLSLFNHNLEIVFIILDPLLLDFLELNYLIIFDFPVPLRVLDHLLLVFDDSHPPPLHLLSALNHLGVIEHALVVICLRETTGLQGRSAALGACTLTHEVIRSSPAVSLDCAFLVTQC